MVFSNDIIYDKEAKKHAVKDMSKTGFSKGYTKLLEKQKIFLQIIEYNNIIYLH